MKSIITILLLALTLNLSASSLPYTDDIRNAFVQASQDKYLRAEFHDLVIQSKTSTAFSMVYQGAAKALLAETIYAPWSKWKYFQDGRDLIEAAIQEDPLNAEFRYIRFLIQINAPSFLDYDTNLKEDYALISKSIETSDSDEVWKAYFERFQLEHTERIQEKVNPRS